VPRSKINCALVGYAVGCLASIMPLLGLGLGIRRVTEPLTGFERINLERDVGRHGWHRSLTFCLYTRHSQKVNGVKPRVRSGVQESEARVRREEGNGKERGRREYTCALALASRRSCLVVWPQSISASKSGASITQGWRLVA